MNKLITKLGVLFVVILSVSSFADTVRLDDDNAFYYYESRAEIKAPTDQLASIISLDYRNAKDEFTKYELMQQIEPALENRMREAASNNVVHILVAGKLQEYDFDLKAFPTGFSEGTYIPFDHGYAATFTNSESIEYLPVEFEAAKSLSSKLRTSRQATFKITAEIVSTSEVDISWKSKKAIELRILSVEVEHKSGINIGTLQL